MRWARSRWWSAGAAGADRDQRAPRWLADWTGAPARLAEIVIGVAALVAILEVLGAVGWFELAPIVAACVAAGAATWC